MTTPQPTDQLEVEWQYSAADTGAVARWLQSAAVPGYTVIPGKTKDLDDTYLDTPDWRIHSARFTCRVRVTGDSSELTIKGMATAVGPIRSRREMNEPLLGGSLPLAAPGICGDLLRVIAGKRELAPIFKLKTQRRTFMLSDTAGLLGEIAVDDTSILVDGSEPARLSRVEVEVDAAVIDRSQRFVDLLVATAGLLPAGTSKFEAALQATRQHPFNPAADLGSTQVEANLTVGAVAYAVMRKQFLAFVANEGGTRIGDDGEALHDMRVATRRLRAAISAFRPSLSPRIETFRTQFGWIAAALGEVRDLDVQLERMTEWRAEVTPAQALALDGVERLLTERRHLARRRMLFAMNSRRYDLLVERFGAFLKRGPVRTVVAGRVSVLSVAPDLVERRYRKVRKMGNRIRSSSPADDYHLLRIDAKKLRYALEFVGGIYGKSAVDFSQRVTALQDVLGLHQDADVAVEMLHQIATASGRKLGPASLLAMGAIAERYRVHAAELRAQFSKVYKPLSGGEWNRLLRLMENRRPSAPRS
ncbi:MAG: CHAD domain-containing protein [Anaerolineaceae bacterium]